MASGGLISKVNYFQAAKEIPQVREERTGGARVNIKVRDSTGDRKYMST